MKKLSIVSYYGFDSEMDGAIHVFNVPEDMDARTVVNICTESVRNMALREYSDGEGGIELPDYDWCVGDIMENVVNDINIQRELAMKSVEYVESLYNVGFVNNDDIMMYQDGEVRLY